MKGPGLHMTYHLTAQPRAPVVVLISLEIEPKMVC